MLFSSDRIWVAKMAGKVALASILLLFALVTNVVFSAYCVWDHLSVARSLQYVNQRNGPIF